MSTGGFKGLVTIALTCVLGLSQPFPATCATQKCSVSFVKGVVYEFPVIEAIGVPPVGVKYQLKFPVP